jgi:hypothetical protein
MASINSELVSATGGSMSFRSAVFAVCAALVSGCSVVAPGVFACTDDLTYRMSPTAQTIAVGESFTPQAEFRGCGGSKPLDDEFSWSSSDTLIVRVEALTGRVTGRAAGSAIVEARGSRYGRLPLGVSVTVR